ncbi:apoptosis facilitator Bcl-2-like protein 14 isoform X2 [Rhinatrema bivittatum]|uniref:apoptosis facilitator Bcl-2-like protein 14 isoform X2 n=1 Tax=Rhinatrema bivittatum TaxID=194408 RepID=UPI00112E745B|nr:apoptosis facilitator Bcl-2-like protein 14 isoform X2 [Rhinatrema bivittatum]
MTSNCLPSMFLASDASMEEIPLDDEEQNCPEYRMLMVFAQRSLPASKYQELMWQSHASIFKPENQGLTLPSAKEKEANRHKGDAETEQIKYIVDKLVKIVHATSLDSLTEPRYLSRSFSVEPDGGVDEDDIIQDIVALLRQSGDRLETRIKEDQALAQSFKGMFSYSFFKKVTDCFLGDLDLSGETEVQKQSVKVAFAMDVTTKLTAIDNHPMNKVMGFGVKYLKEHFSPWIENHGGWGHALGLSTDEEVE